SKVVFTKEEDAPRILEQAYAMQKSMQGQASGYDLLTQCYGGLLLYQADLMTWPGAWHQQNEFESQLLSFVHIFVGGKGAPTTELLKDTVPWLAKKQGELIQLSNSLVDMLLHFWRSPSLESKKNFFTQLQAWRVFFSSAPHYPKNLFQQLNVIPGLDHSWTYKSSGAGGEDALILFGDKQDLVFATKVLQDRGWFRLDLKLAKQGLSFASHR
ncbi:MAG: hypothetical protein KA436_08715, partial [Oligoflexales bacterium]|nr:hypothetical protein [Oligoflexales bacterium]